MNRTSEKYTIKCTNIDKMGVPEREERKKRVGKIFGDILAENFPNLMENINLHIQGAQRHQV